MNTSSSPTLLGLRPKYTSSFQVASFVNHEWPPPVSIYSNGARIGIPNNCVSGVRTHLFQRRPEEHVPSIFTGLLLKCRLYNTVGGSLTGCTLCVRILSSFEQIISIMNFVGIHQALLRFRLAEDPPLTHALNNCEPAVPLCGLSFVVHRYQYVLNHRGHDLIRGEKIRVDNILHSGKI